MPTADTALGRLGGGICFDYDFPQYTRHAGHAQRRVDLMLQPSWTWGSMGRYHTAGEYGAAAAFMW